MNDGAAEYRHPSPFLNSTRRRHRVEGGFLPEVPSPPLARAAAAARAAPAPPARQPAAGWAPPPDPDRIEQYPEAWGAQAGCSRCDSLTFAADWHRAFAVTLCGQCKRQESLISKSTAKQRYSLSDAELAPLGSLRKANPHKKDWQAMHLYLESQVARVSHQKYGGAEGLVRHQQARLDSSLHTKIKRREQEKQREERDGERLRRIRQRIAEGGDEGLQLAAATEAGQLAGVEMEDI